MEQVTLPATASRATGTRNSRRLRREGSVPAVVYGPGGEAVTISVRWADLRKALTTDAGANAVVELDIEGSKQLSIVKEIQRHPVRRDVTHVDFLRVDPEREVEVTIPISVTGTAEKVTQKRGTVDQAMFELRAMAKPGDIPTRLVVDVSDLDVGDAIRVADLDLPAGVTTSVNPDEPIVVGVATRATLEAERTGAAGEEGAEEGEEGAETEGGGGEAEASDEAGDGAGEEGGE